jgi:hypothetical protein
MKVPNTTPAGDVGDGAYRTVLVVEGSEKALRELERILRIVSESVESAASLRLVWGEKAANGPAFARAEPKHKWKGGIDY